MKKRQLVSVPPPAEMNKRHVTTRVKQANETVATIETKAAKNLAVTRARPHKAIAGHRRAASRIHVASSIAHARPIDAQSA